jgi:hypothetical protein
MEDFRLQEAFEAEGILDVFQGRETSCGRKDSFKTVQIPK